MRWPGATVCEASGSMRLMPFSSRVSCIDTSLKRALLAPESVTGMAQGFSIVK